MVNTFLSDKKEEIGSLLSVTCHFVRFSNYKVKVLPELKMPVDNGPPIIEKNVEVVSGVPPVVRSDDPKLIIDDTQMDVIHRVVFEKDILFEVLGLTKSVDVEAGFDEQTIQAIPTTGILDLCRKYGLNYKIGGPIWMQYRIPGFELRNFKYQLFALRWRFAVYMAYCYEDYELMRKLVPLIDMPVPRTSNKQVLDATKEWLTQYTGPGIELSLVSTNEGFGLEVYANNIIDTCNVFLSLLIASGDCKNIKICPNCRHIFFGHGNKKYCDNCNRKTVWSRKNRKDKKKGGEG